MTDSGVEKVNRKYVPKPEGLNLEFHLACVENGLLSLQHCLDCGEFRHPPRWYCPSCHSANYEFSPVSGRGEIYSMAINHFTIDRGWIDDLPYITAVVQLPEGPRVVGSLQGIEKSAEAVGSVPLGQPVQITVEPRGDEFAFLVVERLEG
ncbi:MAG: putative OB-fold protein [Acidimicrobiales bacterium]|jgi:uncharacterized protein